MEQKFTNKTTTMSKKKILFVLRDLVPARIALALIPLLQAAGYEVDVIAEGRAVNECREKGVEVSRNGDDTMAPIMTAMILHQVKPDLVCVGCSSPSNWEKAFAAVAKKSKIPVMAIADIWGALPRLQATGTGSSVPEKWTGAGTPFVVDFACVIDRSEQRKVTRQSKLAKVGIITGDIASATADAMIRTQGSKLHETRLSELYGARRRLILVVGDNNDLVPDICRAVAHAISESEEPRQYVVVPRLVHPKFQHDEDVSRMVAAALAEFDGLQVEHFSVGDDRASTDWLATRCTIVAASYSTPCRIALHAKMRAVSIQSPLCLEWMEKETGSRTFPLCENGAIPILGRDVSSFDTIKAGLPHEWIQKAKFNPHAAMRVIKKLFSRRIRKASIVPSSERT